MRVRKNKEGFTLIEAMVGVTILVLGITGGVFILTESTKQAAEARDQTTAYFLAQEAIEYIRNTRDTNILRNNDWLNRLGNCIATTYPNGCYIEDITLVPTGSSPAAVRCLTSPCSEVVEFSTNDFLYGEFASGDEKTIFERVIRITETENDIEAKINVEVNWSGNSYVLEEYMYNWAK